MNNALPPLVIIIIALGIAFGTQLTKPKSFDPSVPNYNPEYLCQFSDLDFKLLHC